MPEKKFYNLDFSSILSNVDKVLGQGISMYLVSSKGVSTQNLEEAIESGRDGLDCQKNYNFCF